MLFEPTCSLLFVIEMVAFILRAIEVSDFRNLKSRRLLKPPWRDFVCQKFEIMKSVLDELVMISFSFHFL